MSQDTENLKTCTNCRQTFPRTPEYFYFTKRKNRAGTYAQPKCKICWNEYSKNYRQTHRAELRNSCRAYDKTVKGIYKKLHHSERGRIVTISLEMFTEWYESQQQKCFYCGVTLEEMLKIQDSYNSRMTRLTIDRMDNSLPYAENNLALCCLRCNHIKGDFFSASEMVEIGRTYIRPIWERRLEQV